MKDSKPVSITPYLDIIVRHRRSALCVLAIGLCATVSLVVMLPNVYRSQAVIMIEPPQVSPDYASMGNTVSRGDTLNVSDQLEALAHRAFAQGRLEELIRKYRLYNARPDRSLSRIKARMEKHIQLIVPQEAIEYESGRSQAKTPDVLYVSFEYYDPVIAQRVTAELADSYIEEGYRDRVKRAHDAVKFLSAKVAEAHGQLNAKEDQVRQLERRYQGSLPQELAANLAELGRLQEELFVVNQQLASERMIEVAPAQGGALSPEQEIVALELQLTQLRSQYSDQYPDVIELKEQIADLRKQIGGSRAASQNADSPAATDGDEIGAGQSRFERQKQALAAQIEAVKARIAATPLHEREIASLTRDYDAMTTRYHELLNKQLSSQIHEDLQKRQQDERLQVLEPANLPLRPDGPDRIAIAILGSLFSIIVSLAIPFGLFFTDTSFKDPDELQADLGIAVVAAIPPVDAETEARAAAMRAIYISSAVMAAVAGLIWIGSWELI